MHQLKYCETCANKGFDPKQGIVCGLTNQKPAFVDTCDDYKLNEVIAKKERFDKLEGRSSETQVDRRLKYLEEKVSILWVWFVISMILTIIGLLGLVYTIIQVM